MQLLIINGSPRGTKSNTQLLLNKFVDGFTKSQPSAKVETCFLNKIKKHHEFIETFKAYDQVIIGFPLYTDSMPGIVMNFIELMPKSKGKTVGFLIQSGFPEAEQSMYVERYLKKLSLRMDWNYAGTIIKGGVEALSIAPEFTKGSMYKKFRLIGAYFGKHQVFDEQKIDQLKKTFKYKLMAQSVSALMIKFGLVSFYWNIHLIKHKALRKRSDAPYS